ncbi:MAG: hypothetical protein JHC93_06475 [Parachlamydiales bacterium]|nr:hypothetical protein [Parachlamydiales bacterium]
MGHINSNYNFDRTEQNPAENQNADKIKPTNYTMKILKDGNNMIVTREFFVMKNSGQGREKITRSFSIPLSVWEGTKNGRTGRHVTILTMQSLAKSLKNMTRDEAEDLLRTGTVIKLGIGTTGNQENKSARSALTVIIVTHPEHRKGEPVFLGVYDKKTKGIGLELHTTDLNLKDHIQYNSKVEKREIKDPAKHKHNRAINKDERAKQLGDWLQDTGGNDKTDKKVVEIGSGAEENENQKSPLTESVFKGSARRNDQDSSVTGNAISNKNEESPKKNPVSSYSTIENDFERLMKQPNLFEIEDKLRNWHTSINAANDLLSGPENVNFKKAENWYKEGFGNLDLEKLREIAGNELKKLRSDQGYMFDLSEKVHQNFDGTELSKKLINELKMKKLIKPEEKFQDFSEYLYDRYQKSEKILAKHFPDKN